MVGLISDPSGGRHHFFIYFAKRHDQSEHTKEITISEHSSILTRELKDNRSKQNDVSWKDFLAGFRYGKEIKQHLKTGHSDLYSLLVNLIVSERNESELYGSLYEGISSKMFTALNKIGVTDNMKANQPRLKISDIINHVLRHADIKKWGGVKFTRLKTGSRGLAINSAEFQIYGFNQSQADNLVTTMNSVLNDSQLLTEIKSYQEIREQLNSKRNKFEYELDELLKGVDSSTKKFEGMCDQCFAAQGINITKDLRKELSDLV